MIRLRRRSRISADGNELYSFINSLHQESIACFNQYCSKDHFSGEVLFRDIKRVRELAEKYHISMKEYEYPSLLSYLSRYRKRYGLMIGAAAASALCIFFSQVVVTIEIQGNERVSEAAVLSALAELDIKKGAFIRNLDLHYCENELSIMMDDIAWAGIRRTGNRIVVQVKETVEQPEMLLERIPCNIIASKEADITYVSVHKGMGVHNVGDHVPKGALLISGISESDTGRMTLHHAEGVIKGIYTEKAVFSEEFCPERYTRTGGRKKLRKLRLFSEDIPLYFGRNISENSEIETSLKYIKIFGKELPVGIVTDTIYETELTDERIADEDIDKMLMEKMYLYEKNFLSDCNIIKRDVRREKTNDSMMFKTEYTVEGNICRQNEIFIK